MAKPDEGRSRAVIGHVTPEVDCGRFPVKRVIGDTVTVEADVFADGHDEVYADLLWRREEDAAWQRVAMLPLGNDRWRGEFPVAAPGRYRYTVTGGIDAFGTWLHDLKKRMDAGQDLRVALATGAAILGSTAGRASGAAQKKLAQWAKRLDLHGGDPETATAVLADGELAAAAAAHHDSAVASRYARELAVTVDRERAGFSSWYELFPRSWSSVAGKHGTLRDVTGRLEYVAEMGFDVVYLPPVHPIGHSFRKGKNNSVEAAKGDTGSPWAIGSEEGGHTAIHPALGTMADFDRLVARARALGMEIALDVAFQCSPDHPWVREHPEFFRKRPDGSIQYAENPPKKYQDIYPLDFESSAWRELWEQLKRVFEFWIAHGVAIFRVDNPHTKAFAFWEWAIAELKAAHPETIFLAEAFTRPRVMERLAKLGFSQSYTYFTWRNTKEELTAYMGDLERTREYLRPNFWPNTPDILHETLQTGGRPAFMSRLVLAATLAANYGIYGPAFELGENRPLRPGSEEYLNSEKYEIRTWDLDAPHSLRPLIAKLNRARRENAALQSNARLLFHTADNPALICYSKRSADGSNTVLAIVNLDPFHAQSGWVTLDLASLGLDADEPFEVHDQLSGNVFLWTGERNYVELRPAEIPAHLFAVRRRIRTEKDFGYGR